MVLSSSRGITSAHLPALLVDLMPPHPGLCLNGKRSSFCPVASLPCPCTHEGGKELRWVWISGAEGSSSGL